ncbi:MAG: MFS transporter [Bacteroidota bacterium]|nr:MFS transporter [Bacteroidota bacterium]
MPNKFRKDLQYFKFCLYGFLKNLRFFEPFLYLFFIEKGLSFFQIGVLIAIREISRNITEIPTGLLADIFGRRKMMIFGFSSYIASFLIFFFSSSYNVFILAMIFYSFGDAFRTGTHKAMILEYLDINKWEEQKVTYYGSTRSWSQIGSAISSVVAAFLVIYSGSYRYIFLYSVIPYLIDLLLMISYPRVLDGVPETGTGISIKARFTEIYYEVRNTLPRISALRAIGSTALFSAYYRIVKDYLQPIILAVVLILPMKLEIPKDKLTALAIGFVYFLVYISGALASRFSGLVTLRAGGLRPILNSSLLIGLGTGFIIGFLFFLNSVFCSILSIIFFVFIVVSENIRKPAGVAYISGLADKKILATSLSIESQVKGLFAAILAPALGFLIDQFGIGEGFMILAFALIILFPIVRINENKM